MGVSSLGAGAPQQISLAPPKNGHTFFHILNLHLLISLPKTHKDTIKIDIFNNKKSGEHAPDPPSFAGSQEKL